MKKILSNLFYGMLLLLIVLFVTGYAIGVRTYVTLSGSMEPAISTGSLCLVDHRRGYDEIQVGDIVAYESPLGSLVVHRVISVTGAGFETRGDNNGISDGVIVTESNFRGKTICALPGVGYVLYYLRQPAGIAMIGILIGAIILIHVVEYRETKQKSMESEEEG